MKHFIIACLLLIGVSALAAGHQLGEHAHITAPSATPAVPIQTDSGKRHWHYSCLVDAAAVGTVYIGDSSVTSADYGDTAVAGERFGGPAGEYAKASTGTILLHCRFVVSEN